MQFAIVSDGSRQEAYKGARATCPQCGGAVLAKCGRIKVNHWAHEAEEDCDSWYEPETAWHRQWKSLFADDCTEVVMREHRADIRSNDLVVELQNSSISPSEIEERERFYGEMIWIVNAEPFAARFFLLKQQKANQFTFKWKHMKASWRFATKPIYFDFGAWTVEKLLGAKYEESTEYYTEGGDIEIGERRTVVRYEGSQAYKGYSADPNFETLSPEVLGRSILKIYSMYDKGYGSVVAVGRPKLLRACGADFSKVMDMSAFQ